MEQTQKGVINILLYQILAYTIHEKILKSHTKLMNLKYQLQRGTKIDQILYQIFKIIFSISLKTWRKD